MLSRNKSLVLKHYFVSENLWPSAKFVAKRKLIIGIIFNSSSVYTYKGNESIWPGMQILLIALFPHTRRFLVFFITAQSTFHSCRVTINNEIDYGLSRSHNSVPTRLLLLLQLSGIELFRRDEGLVERKFRSIAATKNWRRVNRQRR
jgi:hypothetical protein